MSPTRIRGRVDHGKMSDLLGFRALAPTFYYTEWRTLPGETATQTATSSEMDSTHHALVFDTRWPASDRRGAVKPEGARPGDG